MGKRKYYTAEAVCGGCGTVKQAERKKLKLLRTANRPYKCNSCAHGGNGLGTTMPCKEKIPKVCIGCMSTFKVRRDSLKKLSSEGREYKCPTCTRRGDGVGAETPLTEDRVSAKCVGCDTQKMVQYRFLKDKNFKYRCFTCTRRGDGVGAETPLNREKVSVECVGGCGKAGFILYSRLKQLKFKYKCPSCSRRRYFDVDTEYFPSRSANVTTCETCGEQGKVRGHNLNRLQRANRAYRCMSCAAKDQTSIPEQEVADFIASLSPDFKIERNDRKILSGKEIDILVTFRRRA